MLWFFLGIDIMSMFYTETVIPPPAAPAARGLPPQERVVIALRAMSYVGTGTPMPFVVQLPYFKSNPQDLFVTYHGLDLVLQEVVSNHRSAEVVVYAFDHNEPTTSLVILDAKLAGLRLAGIPTRLVRSTNWNELVTAETVQR